MKEKHLSTLSHLKERVELIKEKPGLLRTKDIELVYKFAGKLASKDYLGGIVQGVVLFGSVMRNEATKESDLDIAIFVKNKFYHQRPELVQLIGSRALHLYYDNQYLRRLYNQHLKDLFEKNKYGY